MTITPITGTSINQVLSVNYQGRTPLTQTISIAVPPLVIAGYYDGYTDLGDPIYQAPSFAVSSNNGTSWTQQVLGSSTTLSNAPAGISCNGSECVAVGGLTDQDGNSNAQIYLSNNYAGSWSQQTLPLLSGVSSSTLLGVSCVGSICNAVGDYIKSDSGDINIGIATSTNSGASWTQQTLYLLCSDT